MRDGSTDKRYDSMQSFPASEIPENRRNVDSAPHRRGPAIAVLSLAMCVGLGVFLLGPEHVAGAVERLVTDYMALSNTLTIRRERAGEVRQTVQPPPGDNARAATGDGTAAAPVVVYGNGLAAEKEHLSPAFIRLMDMNRTGVPD